MKKKTTKIISVLLSLVMLATMLPAISLTATAAEIQTENETVDTKRGTAGDCTWMLGDNTLMVKLEIILKAHGKMKT